jgi:hypothetical protein
MSDHREERTRDNLSHVTEWLLLGGEIANADQMARLTA